MSDTTNALGIDPGGHVSPADVEHINRERRDINRAWARMLSAEINGRSRALVRAAEDLQLLGVDVDALLEEADSEMT